MTQATPDKHKEFNLETQLQLDRLWLAWATHDRTGDYLNDTWCKRYDELWEQYETALDAAYYAKAEAEVPAVIAEFGDRYRAAIIAAGFQTLSKRLTAKAATQ